MKEKPVLCEECATIGFQRPSACCPSPSKYPKVLIENDACPVCIEGIMWYAPVEGCSCHINPPCSQCTDNPLVCDACGYEEE